MIRGALSGLLVGTMRRRGASFGPGSGVGGGLSAALDLNFTSGTLDPRVTYSGASLATLTDATGAIAYKPHNLLTYSEQFDNAAWPLSGSTVTANATTGPDGNATADKLVESVGAGAHLLNRAGATVSVASVLSVYAKAAERTQIALQLGADVGYYNLSTGAVISGANASIVNVGNGWYRCILTGTPVNTNSLIYLASGGAASYIGDGTSGVYVWGAQLNIGPLQPYYPTTSAAYYGPRFTYDPVTHASLGLLIEEQRTNLLKYSEQFDNAAWTGLGASATANATTAPDGNTTADKVVAAATTNWHGTRQTAVTLTSGVAATLSVYAKAAEETKVAVSDYAMSATGVIFDLSAVTAVVIGSDAGLSLSNPTITNVGGGWYRCAVTMTASVAGRIPTIYLRQFATSYAGDGTSGIYLWGAQLEAGAFATSYIPTTSASVTRAADSATMTGSNFSSWFNATQGTFVPETTPSNLNTVEEAIAVAMLNTNNFIGIGRNYGGGSPTGIVLWVNDSSVSQAYIVAGTVSAGTKYKAAASYAANAFAECVNGGIVGTDVSGTVPASLNTLKIGQTHNGIYANSVISRLRYYNTALTNAQLQALTT